MSYQIEFRNLHSFLVLAEELHFRKAAEKLFISQPGLSKQIKHLEAQLGVKLLDRDRRNVRLTEGGEYLKQQVSQLEGFLTHTINHLKGLESGIEGEIKIGFVGSAMQKVIPEFIKTCTVNYPKIRFALDEMSNQAQIEALQRYQIDLAFVRLKEVPSDIELRPIFEEHFSLVIPKNHQINSANFKNIQQFKNSPFILFSSDYSSTYYNKVMSIFSDAGFNPQISHKSIHANTIFRLVESGLGVAIVPNSLTLGAALAMDIQVIHLTKIRQRAILSIAWKKERHYPVLDRVMEFLN